MIVLAVLLASALAGTVWLAYECHVAPEMADIPKTRPDPERIRP